MIPPYQLPGAVRKHVTPTVDRKTRILDFISPVSNLTSLRGSPSTQVSLVTCCFEAFRFCPLCTSVEYIYTYIYIYIYIFFFFIYSLSCYLHWLVRRAVTHQLVCPRNSSQSLNHQIHRTIWMSCWGCVQVSLQVGEWIVRTLLMLMLLQCALQDWGWWLSGELK
jgi:hypothetical protein